MPSLYHQVALVTEEWVAFFDFHRWQAHTLHLSPLGWISCHSCFCFLFSKTFGVIVAFCSFGSFPCLFLFFKNVIIYLFCPVCSAYGMVSRPGIELTPTQWKQKPLPPSHRGTSLVYSLQWFFFFLGGWGGGVSRRLRGKHIYLLCLMKIPSSGILWFFKCLNL